MNGPREPAGRTRRALVICPDRALAAELLRVLSSRALAPVVHHSYPPPGALAAQPGLCFVDAQTDPETALRLIGELSTRWPCLPLVALLGRNDPDMILRCLRTGASEFLVYPFSEQEWEAVWERIAGVGFGNVPDFKGGKVYCVVPGKGAAGATTTAVNLAFQLKRAGHQKALLADLDTLTGTVGFQLKLKSSYNFLDALTHSDRLDADLWKVIVNHVRGVDVLLAPEDPAGVGQDWDPAPLVDFCRTRYDVIVLDTGGAFGDWNLAAARQADELLLVTTAELPSLHATQRALAYWDEQGLGRDRLRLLLNRHGRERTLTAEAIGEALDCPVFHVLPADPETLDKAVMEGKPVSPASRFGKSLAELVERLERPPQRGRARSLLSLLFRSP
ncbi:MAG: hypothetical protein RMI94_09730 [Bryobacterales bacterium]|nr:hypothetical protein [Bryobacteraceae bacterium]MDW8130815.1 hypothetical protein [Bryobacterales bacterium]